MSPEVVTRKLTFLKRYLDELQRYAAMPKPQAKAERYALERLCQLAVEVLSDITTHWLAAKHGYAAEGYKQAFRRAGELGVFPPDVASGLEKAAGLRNLLVHLYEEVDIDRLIDNLPALVSTAEQAAVALLKAVSESGLK